MKKKGVIILGLALVLLCSVGVYSGEKNSIRIKISKKTEEDKNELKSTINSPDGFFCRRWKI